MFNRLTHLCVINENLNSQRYIDETSRPIVMQFLDESDHDQFTKTIKLDPIVAALLMTLCSKTALLGLTGLQTPLI